MARIGKYKTVHLKASLHDRLAALARKPKKPITKVIEELVAKQEIDRKKERGTLRS